MGEVLVVVARPVEEAAEVCIQPAARSLALRAKFDGCPLMKKAMAYRGKHSVLSAPDRHADHQPLSRRTEARGLWSFTYGGHLPESRRYAVVPSIWLEKCSESWKKLDEVGKSAAAE